MKPDTPYSNVKSPEEELRGCWIRAPLDQAPGPAPGRGGEEEKKKKESTVEEGKKNRRSKRSVGVWRENKSDGGWWRSAHVRTLRLQGITSQRNTSCCSIFSRGKEKRSPPEEHREPLEGRSGFLCVFSS